MLFTSISIICVFEGKEEAYVLDRTNGLFLPLKSLKKDDVRAVNHLLIDAFVKQKFSTRFFAPKSEQLSSHFYKVNGINTYYLGDRSSDHEFKKALEQTLGRDDTHRAVLNVQVPKMDRIQIDNVLIAYVK